MDMHILNRDENALCGATLLPWETTPMTEWNWTEEREEATCLACTDRWDEEAFDRQEESSSGRFDLESHYADVAVEESRGIFD